MQAGSTASNATSQPEGVASPAVGSQQPGSKVHSFRSGVTQLSGRPLMLAIALVDALLIASCTYFAIVMRLGGHFERWLYLKPFEVYTGASTFTICSCILSLFIFELYTPSRVLRISNVLARLGMAVACTALIMSVVSYWFPPWRLFRGMQLYVSASAFLTLALWRIVSIRLMTNWLPPSRVVLIGCTEHLDLIKRTIQQHPLAKLEVAAAISVAKVAESAGSPQPDPFELPNLLQVAQGNDATTIIASFDGTPREELLQEVLRCKSAGLRVIDGATVYKRLTGRIPVRLVDTGWLAFGPDFDLSGNVKARIFQRAMDIALSLVGLVLATPIMLLTALVVGISQGAPVLFRQERVGENEQPYTLIKFRTMRNDAEKGGPQWATANDSRVTPIGRFLRATRIDELPQLWCVLKGDMSFIGPRPERAFFVSQLKQTVRYYGLRFSVKPGLTGWAQVNYGYGSTDEDALAKLEYDLFYIQEMSPYLNLLILLRTVSTVIFRRGT